MTTRTSLTLFWLAQRGLQLAKNTLLVKDAVGTAPGACLHSPTLPGALLLPPCGKFGLSTSFCLPGSETFLNPLQSDVREECLHGGLGGKKDRLGRRKDAWGKIIKNTVTVNLTELF